jgi:hypothetical protein
MRLRQVFPEATNKFVTLGIDKSADRRGRENEEKSEYGLVGHLTQLRHDSSPGAAHLRQVEIAIKAMSYQNVLRFS